MTCREGPDKQRGTYWKRCRCGRWVELAGVYEWGCFVADEAVECWCGELVGEE